MKILFKFVLAKLILLIVLICAYDPVKGSPLSIALNSANISPEIVNELKDFEHLIPTAVVDAIVAEHIVIDGNFRKALKYLRSNDFIHLQKQLMDVPEIITVLDFLHMTSNASVDSNAAGTPTTTTDEAVRASSSSSTVNDNGIVKITANTVTTGTGAGTGTMATSANVMVMGTRDVHAYKRPQLDELENTVDVSVGAASAEQLPLVDIVLLDAEANTLQVYDNAEAVTNKVDAHSLGSFTSFVEEIIGQLPQAAYQHMIIDKCKKNAKFADFYRALRSAEFKPLVDEAMKTSNIQKIIQTLSSKDIDVKSLEPIAFKVISWGPNV